ncbi:hypothetical protein ACHAP5_008348 [Fusarium lateritium]
MMKSLHHSSTEKKKLKDVPPLATEKSGSKTPTHQQTMPHQPKTPSSQKKMVATQATPSLTRNRQTGPYIRFKNSFDKPGAGSATPFDRTSAEEGSQRNIDLPRITYSQQPLVSFSSNAAAPPKDAPKGPRADRSKMNSVSEQRGYIPSSSSSLPPARPDNSLATGRNHNANALAAAIRSQAIPDIARKTLGVTCKSKVMELCLSLKDEYLAMNPAPLHDQEPFWTQLLEKLESNIVTQGKFKVWKDIKDGIDQWCQPRRALLREGTLPPVSQSQPELDGLIDSWNEVFVRRFCKINRGYFRALSGYHHVENWISNSLKNRRSELGRFARPTLLSSGSSTADYHNAARDLQTQFEATKRDASQIVDTEAIMSIITDLQPGLKHAISRRLNRDNNVNPARLRLEEGNGSNVSYLRTALSPTKLDRDTQSQGRNATDLDDSKRVSFRIPPTGEPKSTTQLFPESSNSREQKIHGTNRPEASNGLTPRPPSVHGRDESTRKRKVSDPPSPRLAASSDLTIRNTIERASNDTPRIETKRPRFDEGRPSFADSNFPPATDFSLERHDQDSPRRNPSRASRYKWNGADGKQGRQGNRNDVSLGSRTPRRPSSPENPNKVPLKPRTPRRPASPSPPRDGPYRQHPDYRTDRYAREFEPPRLLDSWRPGADRNHERLRNWRENTVEFQRMPTERQNMSLRNQMKGMENQLKALLEKDRP